MENQPKILSISELLHRSLPLSGTSYLNSSSSSTNLKFHQQQKQQSSPTPSTSAQSPNSKTLSPLNHPTIIIGTLSLPTYTSSSSSSNSMSCNCFSFSDGSSRVCCAILDLDVKIIGKRIHVLAWNFIPFKCGGNGLLEIIKWSVSESKSKLTRCSNIDVFPLDFSSSFFNYSRDQIFDARSSVFGRLKSISPVSLIPCTTQSCDSQISSGKNSTGSRNVNGFLAELFVCQCTLCGSKASVVTTLREGNSHLFNVPVMVYFFEAASSWHPVFSKLLGGVVCVTGLKKKLIFIGKNDSHLMFITTEKAALHIPLLPPEHFPLERVAIKGKGEFGAYTGIVTGVYMQSMVVELDEKVWLLLTDRALTLPHPIRVGALMSLENVHFVCPKFSWTRMVLLGACFKTSINVKSFSALDSQCHIRFQAQSMLGKFTESLMFSVRFWLLLIVSSFKKKFAGLFSDKEILGSKHKEGLAQIYAKSQLPSCVIRPRHGVFAEFCNHDFCGCGNEPSYTDLKLVVPFSSFISHCEAIWVNFILRMQNDAEGIKSSLYWCGGKSYYRLIRRIMSSEDFGFILMGTLQISPSSGRLQMVDASGSIDVVIPDLPSNYSANNIYEVKHYSVVIEGLPEAADASIIYESELFSCRSIFHHVPSTRGIKPTSIYVHFYMRNSTCLNFCLRLPCLDWSDTLMGIKDGLFHLFLVTHKFPARQNFHVNPTKKANSFAEAIMLPWDLFLRGEHEDIHMEDCSQENIKDNLKYTYRRSSSEDHCQKRPKLTHGAIRTATSTLKDNMREAHNGSYGYFSKCDNPTCGTTSEIRSIDMDSSHELSCLVLMRSFNNYKPARPGVLIRATYNLMDGVVDKLCGRKIMLEFKSECFSSYQLLQVGGYYIMRHGEEVAFVNVKDLCRVSGGKTLVTSQTPLWSVSFSCDEVASLSEPVQKKSLPIASIRTDVVPFVNFSTGDLFVQRSPSHNPKTCPSDVNLYLSIAAWNQLKLDLEVVEDRLVEPIAISWEIDNSFMFMMSASVHSSGIVDPSCRLPQGSLISIHGNVVDVHTSDCYSADFRTHPSSKGISDIQHQRFFQVLPSSICIHISKGHRAIKLRGTLSKHAYPIGMGPGINASFHRVLVTGQHELMLTPVSFIVINSMNKVDKNCSDSSYSQFRPDIFNGRSLDMISLFSESIPHFENKMHFRCRVVAIHLLILENKIFDVENPQSREQYEAPGIDIPCAGFILDDGSLPCCCWASAERAVTLLRLDEETMVKAICSDSWKLKRRNVDKSPTTANCHLQKILKTHQRITIKNYGAMFGSSCQDLTFSVNSDNVLSSSDENFLKLMIINACCGTVLNIVGTIMDSAAIGQLEELAGMDMSMDTMQTIWATEVRYPNYRTEATNLIQELMK